ncbi:ATP-dependent DNA helicase [Histomonas meleagridis]|uniref:ATP-dependent DNA helicase n=1 Tax=Histomonas meleagridis TaxID=135588 RepID=UPI00355A9959|nr:ATP-dependent DNA helicase [Histomonas meleagridis]KAH0796809.1 ATP-dependent DNA helicase [Histomonas meleagridis]
MTFNSFLNDLNEEQLQAVHASFEEPLFVYAGAGSGKTRTLICRISNMITNGINPDNILAISFTRKSTEEIRERLRAFIGPRGSNVATMTFHKLCFQILRENPFILGFGQKPFHVADPSTQRKIVQNACIQLLQKSKNKNLSAQNPNVLRIMTIKMLNFVRRAKTLFKSPDDFKDDLSFVLHYYQDQLKLHRLIDFNDFMSFTEQLLKQYPRVAYEYRKIYQYILIDEFQDTSISNFTIIKYILGNSQRITIFGDWRQSIYGFRGANPSNISSFLELFPNSNKVILNKNYRSTQTILNAAQSLIVHNSDDNFSSPLISKQKLGDLIRIIEAEDSLSEADKICTEIEKLVYPGSEFQYRDIVIMFRVRKIATDIEMELFRRNIPYTHKRGFGFFMKKEVRDLISYVRLILSYDNVEMLSQNENDQIITNDVESVINVPFRNIGQNVIKTLKNKSIKEGKNLLQIMKEITENEIGKTTYKRIQKFLKLLEKMNRQIYIINKSIAVNTALQEIIEATHILDEEKNEIETNNETIIDEFDEINDALNDYLNDKKETMELLVEEAKRFQWNILQSNEQNQIYSTAENLKKFINSITFDITGDTSKNAITLSTIHQMKGLESPICFIMRFNQGVLPVSDSVTAESGIEGFGSATTLEEERRIAYVALTRAKQKLFISFCKYAKNKPLEPSQFLDEISNSCIAKSQINLEDKKEIMQLMSMADDFDDIEIE